MIDLLKRAKRDLGTWWVVSKEIFPRRPAQAPKLLGKAMLANYFWGRDPLRGFSSGMLDSRIGSWADYLSFYQELQPGLTAINWQGESKKLIEDKLLSGERFAEAGLPMVPILGVVGRDEAAHPHAGRFRIASSLPDVIALLDGAPDHIFVKPVGGKRGGGVSAPERRAGGWAVDEVSLSPDALARRLLDEAPPEGLLVQPRLRSHKDLAPVGGELGLTSARINTALTSSGVEIVFVFFKVMGAKGLVDNFSGGRFGNLLAGVDIATGEVFKVVRRQPGCRFLMQPATAHPVTGAPLIGYRVPMWQEALALAKRTALAFPRAPMVGTDVALTEDGPIVVEVNADWDASVPQVLYGGLRPLLRRFVPRLQMGEALRADAVRKLRL